MEQRRLEREAHAVKPAKALPATEAQRAAERLHGAWIASAERKTLLAVQGAMTEMNENKAPNLNPTSLRLASRNRVSLAERSIALHKAHEEELARERIRQQVEEQSRVRVVVTDEFPVERLQAMAQRREARLREAQRRAEEREQTALLPVPRIDAHSAELAAKRFANTTFIERQAHEEHRRTERSAHVQAEQRRATEPPLRAPSESVDDLARRLSQLDAQRIAAARAQTRESYYAAFDFAPKINARSRALPGRSVDELVHDRQAERRRERAQRIAEEARTKECTFRPHLVAPYPVSESGLSQSRSRAADESLRRRAQREIDEAVECTFKPVVHRAPAASPSRPVPGMDGFLAKLRLAKELKAEQRAREDKAFLTDVAAAPLHRRYTVPRPFQLS